MERIRIVKQPRVGEYVSLKFGTSRVLSVHEHGRRLVVQTRVHGVEHVERGERGHWTVVAAPGAMRTKETHGQVTTVVAEIGPGEADSGERYYVQPSRRGGAWGEYGYITRNRVRWSVNIPGGVPAYAVITRPGWRAVAVTLYEHGGDHRSKDRGDAIRGQRRRGIR